jgi:hypothetical protein
VAWQVEVTDEFTAWYQALPEELQDTITAKVELLEQYGPYLGRPHADTLARMSKHSNMKELIVQHGGGAYRILFAFDPRRVAILLLVIESLTTVGTNTRSRGETRFTTSI